MSSLHVPRSGSRLEYLDGLRGFGALTVVLNHYCGIFSVLFSAEFASWCSLPPLTVLLDARYAVFLFFVLSGFVLSQSAGNLKRTLPARLVARYLRLTIPMLASLIYARILYTLFPRSRLILENFENSVGRPNYWLHADIAELPNFIGTLKEGLYRTYMTGHCALNNVTWTMRKELIGSIVIYVLYRYCPRSYLLAAIGIIAATTLYSPVYLGFPLGAFLREIWQRGWVHDNKWFWILPFATAIYLSTNWMQFWHNATPETVPASLPFLNQDFYSTLSAGLLIYVMLTSAPLRWFFCTPIPQFLGRISFALYLVHFPLLSTVMTWLFLHLTMSLYPRLLLVFVIYVPTAILIAWYFTIWLDEPLMLQLHRLKKLSFLPSPQPKGHLMGMKES